MQWQLEYHPRDDVMRAAIATKLESKSIPLPIFWTSQTPHFRGPQLLNGDVTNGGMLQGCTFKNSEVPSEGMVYYFFLLTITIKSHGPPTGAALQEYLYHFQMTGAGRPMQWSPPVLSLD